MTWWIWLIVTAALLVGELVTEGFFLFWFALGALGATIAAALKASMPVQLVVFILISGVLLFFSRQLGEKLSRGKSEVQTNTGALMGKTGIVIKEIKPPEAGVVKVEGQEWSGISETQTTIPCGAKVQIIALQGVTLTVRPVSEEKAG